MLYSPGDVAVVSIRAARRYRATSMLRALPPPAQARTQGGQRQAQPEGGALLLLATGVGAASGCGGGASSATAPAADTGFVVTGNPEAAGGASWSYRGTVGGVAYDLTGVLLKPPGSGPFPAVVLSHGAGGVASDYGVALGSVMVGWGMVAIAVNYTHSAGVPIGAPGDASQPGASQANLLRAQRTYELLARLGYVDLTRVAAHGHSMGAYVTTALLGAHPGEFRVASHTGGGVRPAAIVIGPAPSPGAAVGITTPYQLHHGELDQTVPLSYELRLDSMLTARTIPHQLFVYPGEDHLGPSRSPVMLQHVHDWYAANGMF